NAAGNDADGVNGYTGHWQGDFSDGNVDYWHDFDSGDPGNDFYLAAGDTVTILMTWDDWPQSDEDYDLHLYGPGGTQVAASQNWQNGTQAPTERIEYTATSSGYYSFRIYRYNALTILEIEVFLWNDSGTALNLEYNTYASSIVTPANSMNVLTVGAIYRGNWTTGPQESYSSQGPSNASKYTASITKPDIMGPDGVSNYTHGSFYGTSASSPHVAGAAALLLSEDSTRTADQLQAKLEADAIDMGSTGKDNIYGSGRLNLQLGGGTAAVFRVTKEGNVYADQGYYGQGFHTGSADVAEWVPVSESVEPGDVLELDPSQPGHYRKSRGPCSSLVAGVVSTNPGVILGSSSPTLDIGPWTLDSALLALLGIVPVKVTDEGGPIQPGDLLVVSSTAGHAMRWDPTDGEACGLVGKALEPLDSGTGMIQMLLMR
ncbi:S8 family serine peptidase, partial [Candidatus Bipolaricaulota bacterium]|nr:S8 family serine peptidase [Candidatus Bipolaricaulota bacterium]